MATEQDVEAFLKDFKIKLSIFSILFRNDRTKNTQALLDLEISQLERKSIIEKLESIDFSEGPIKDQLYQISDMWIFGKKVKGKEVYIKISMGLPNSTVICISFHIAEASMKYPFKKGRI